MYLMEDQMVQGSDVALEEMNFDVVYRPESTTENPLTHEQLARDMEGWNSLLNAITDENTMLKMDDREHIVMMVQEALAGAFEEFQKTLACHCRFGESEE